MNTQAYCWSCNQPGGEMLHYGNIHIHNRPECRHIAGIPDDEPEHNGNLDEFGGAQVRITDGHVYISETETIELTPAQALSLLAWLTQKDVKLQSLAKEQEG